MKKQLAKTARAAFCNHFIEIGERDLLSDPGGGYVCV